MGAKLGDKILSPNFIKATKNITEVVRKAQLINQVHILMPFLFHRKHHPELSNKRNLGVILGSHFGINQDNIGISEKRPKISVSHKHLILNSVMSKNIHPSMI